MITTKENGTIYTNGLTQAVIDFHYENNLTIAWLERPLKYEEEENEFGFKNYIDDITLEEIQKGYEKVREFMYKNYTDSLFFKAQRGEIDNQVWLDAIQEIKDKYKG